MAHNIFHEYSHMCFIKQDVMKQVTEGHLFNLFIELLNLQISEVVNSMKDLIDYSRETRTGPVGKFIPSSI